MNKIDELHRAAQACARADAIYEKAPKHEPGSAGRVSRACESFRYLADPRTVMALVKAYRAAKESGYHVCPPRDGKGYPGDCSICGAIEKVEAL